MRKSAAEREEPMNKDHNESIDRNRSMRLKLTIEEIFEKNSELLDRLGSDYDENGIPYWEKTGVVDPDDR